MRIADYIIDYIYKNGTDTIFTLAGGGAMFLNDAVACHKKMKYVCNHHEQASAMAAEAYAKTNQGIGAVMVTSGPGSTNAITGLLEAWQNSIPVIFISSQAKKSQMTHFSGLPIRQFGIQELDIIPIVRPLTKYADYVEKPEEIRFKIEKAYQEMLSGRPGPVWLDIPPDVASQSIDPEKLPGFVDKKTPNSLPKISTREIGLVINLLNRARKPIIIAGGGIKLAKAVSEFRALVNILKIPVVVPEMGIDLLENNHPCYAGHGGTKGDRAGNIVIQNSDLILAIGSRLSVSFTGHEFDKYAPRSVKIVIDVDEKEHQKKTVKINHLIISDAKYFIEEMIKNKQKLIDNKNVWLKKCQIIKNKYGLYLPKIKDKNGEISMYHIVDTISKLSRPGDFFITDAGVTAYIAVQTLKFKKNQRMIIPGATLTMGYNLPAILGVWAANKNARIICITGDGSLQMNIHELGTIAYHKIPAKIFVINNHGYLAIRTTQKNFFQSRLIGEGSGSGVYLPSSQKIAQAYGYKYVRIKNYKELSKIKQVMKEKSAVICEVFSPYWQDVLTVSSKKMPDGKMVSLPIDDMYPFLPEEEMKQIRQSLK
ncbi:MAG: Thiamine pyrophosphate protein central region [Candidatus Roizmanbacteria bacterium GW2011_GWC2_37_13]|uniref:Thiamine pyrophosphate protein central region n=1 Tax=Candidatus Roizmanbacteria bacterium GW2011_GWC2_37_13 TaxID=1618486 RepID=A0A0G0JEV8_9BACT|nr:MAG: Thiamine pyrophosphate protein central region [Candidatus Roizmanbacteria bacterium GW2011_GWC1_37_12]KKQ26701.1 MAG: Thiamine pyrophosphate protein central region [Candidatus Roizmanbacteria bacterium GW2011_GWC2_37_13]